MKKDYREYYLPEVLTRQDRVRLEVKSLNNNNNVQFFITSSRD